MSAVAPPHAVYEPVQIGPAKEVSEGDKFMPMNNLPLIQRTMTTLEANQKRHHYIAPDVIPGEFVFYRAYGSTKEECAFILGQSNRTFKMRIIPDRSVPFTKDSVGYYDFTQADPLKTADPMAPFNNNGTFRRTMHASAISELFTRLRGAPELTGELTLLKRQFLEICQIVDQVKQAVDAIAEGIKNQTAANMKQTPPPVDAPSDPKPAEQPKKKG